MAFRNSTTSFHCSSFASAWEKTSTSYEGKLSTLEELWAAWHLYIGNPTLATGLLSFALHEIVYFGRSFPWIIIDRVSWFRQFKIQQHKIPSAQEQWRCAFLVLVSHFTVELPQIWLFHPAACFFGIRTDAVPFPTFPIMAAQIAIFFIVEDTWHYWMHRALHWGPLYRNIHKIHHQFSAPFGLAAEYASPIEVMILGLGTVGAPILYCAVAGPSGLHIVTVYLWICLRLFQAIDAHSGYDFPWSLHHLFPAWAGANHHDVHHERFIGNYSSSFRWWDICMKTENKGKAISQQRKRGLKGLEVKQE